MTGWGDTRRKRFDTMVAKGWIKLTNWDEWPKASAGDTGEATITTNCGHVILIDSDLFDSLNRYVWHISSGYAATHSAREGIFMHRLILGLRAEDKRICDHINHNRLDNRRANLRACDRADNNRNISGRGRRIAKYKGVAPNRDRWMAQITFQRKCHHLGTFDTQEEAALAYNEAARRFHGEFAFVNIVP